MLSFMETEAPALLCLPAVLIHRRSASSKHDPSRACRPEVLLSSLPGGADQSEVAWRGERAKAPYLMKEVPPPRLLGDARRGVSGGQGRTAAAAAARVFRRREAV